MIDKSSSKSIGTQPKKQKKFLSNTNTTEALHRKLLKQDGESSDNNSLNRVPTKVEKRNPKIPKTEQLTDKQRARVSIEK